MGQIVFIENWDQKSCSSNKERNKKEQLTLMDKLLLLTSTILITLTSVVASALTLLACLY